MRCGPLRAKSSLIEALEAALLSDIITDGSRWKSTGRRTHCFGRKVDGWKKKSSWEAFQPVSFRWEDPGGNRRKPLITTVSQWSICMDELQADNELALTFLLFLRVAVSLPPSKLVAHHWESSRLYKTAMTKSMPYSKIKGKGYSLSPRDSALPCIFCPPLLHLKLNKPQSYPHSLIKSRPVGCFFLSFWLRLQC